MSDLAGLRERVARAIARRHGLEWDHAVNGRVWLKWELRPGQTLEGYVELNWRGHLDDADAAIREVLSALREPSEGMQCEGREARHRALQDLWKPAGAADIDQFTAMLAQAEREIFAQQEHDRGERQHLTKDP